MSHGMSIFVSFQAIDDLQICKYIICFQELLSLVSAVYLA